MRAQTTVLALLLATLTWGQTSVSGGGEIVNGVEWKDTSGNRLNAHGAGIMYHNGRYYLYGEYRTNAPKADADGQAPLPAGTTVSCYSSTDLATWRFEGIALPRVNNVRSHDLYPTKKLERPKVVYNARTGKFVMWMHIEGTDYSRAAAGVAVSDTPQGPFTYLGSFRPNNAMSRDQTIFVDDDGTAYQFCSSEENQTLHINELTADYLRPTGRESRAFVGKAREAPAVFKYQGKYYMLTSGCTGWAPNKADLAVADSVMGPWTMLGNPCTGLEADKTFLGQSTHVQQVYGKKGLYVAMFDRWTPDDLENSRYVWLPLQLSAEGITIPWRERWSPNEFPEQPRFEAGNGSFLLNGQPYVVKAAELHYPRIPRPYWEQRIELCKALGMNTICLYTFWNAHEPREGQYDFTGQNDLRAFIQLCAKHGMKVILRPGPYVCAEWEMGGLPWWLLKKKDIRLRENDQYFLERVDSFQKALAGQVADLTIDRGGPIIMIQVENEYGSYGIDKQYVGNIRDMVRKHFGRQVALFQCDWSSNFLDNGLDDMIWTVNFGTGANIEQQFERLKKVRPSAPLMCSEFWSGWFDKWGANHETRGADEMIAGLDEMLRRGISFSLYMTHGGTNWGHWAGANSPGYAPDVTSYDYDAPITESGQTTAKYWKLRELLGKYTGGAPLPKVPATITPTAVPRFALTEVAPLWDNLPEAKSDLDIHTMEEYDQGFGSIVYSTILPELAEGALLTVREAHDYAQVFVDGAYVGKLDRRNGEKELRLPAAKKGARLDILVEAMGRINFGRAIKDFKGITECVTLTVDKQGYQWVNQLKDWRVYNIEDALGTYTRMKYRPLSEVTQAGARLPRGAYRGSFTVKKPSDTFLDLSTWGKGLVYVNGHALGRFWEIGPQQTLYVPGCWLRKGTNEIVVFDIVGPRSATVEGLTKPKLDELQVPKRTVHREAGQQLDLSGSQAAHSGQFKPGNGWQEAHFASPVRGRYVCLEALSAQDGGAVAAVAELHLLDEQGQRLSREPWTVTYADSEEVGGVNRSADKTYDLQESTYWQTSPGAAYPHAVVYDLGAEHLVAGLQYLPRMESGAPGSVRQYKVYVSSKPFKM